MPELMWLFTFPFLAATFLLLLPFRGKWLQAGALILSLVPFIFLLIQPFSWIGKEVDYAWLTGLSVHFNLKIDSLSFLFLLLTAVVIPIAIMAANAEKLEYPKAFYALVLFLQGLLIGFFTARDLVFFAVFWEAMLLPLYFIINLWGGENRQRASLKFLIYMIAGSALLVASVLGLYFAALPLGFNTFSLEQLASISQNTLYAAPIFGVFLLAFAVKTPLFPFHAWLPDAYTQAPTSGTILLSALLSKAGIYGIIRIGMELFPFLLKEWSPYLIALSITGVFYGGFAAWMQKDFKRLLAYSSFSHVNFILAGLFVWEYPGQLGAVLQAINHWITITGLFLVAGWLEERVGSTSMHSLSGLCRFMPHLCWVTLIFVLSSVALPGMNNFVGEILILLGLFKQNFWPASALSLTAVLSAVYMLRWMQKVFFGPPTFFKATWIDIGFKEMVLTFPLVAFILWIGIFPGPVLKLIQPEQEKPLAVEILK